MSEKNTVWSVVDAILMLLATLLLVGFVVKEVCGINTQSFQKVSVVPIITKLDKSSKYNLVCYAGYLMTPSGRQMIDEKGHGITCKITR